MNNDISQNEYLYKTIIYEKIIIVYNDIDYKVLFNIRNNFENKDVIYLREDRRFGFNKDEIDCLDLLISLSDYPSVKNFVHLELNIQDQFSCEEINANLILHCGYLRLLNMCYNFVKAKMSNKPFIVELFYANLHPLILHKLLNFFAIYDKCLLITNYNYSNYKLPRIKKNSYNEKKLTINSIYNHLINDN